MKIESKDVDIESLLDGSYFYIPRFQRPYSWDDENINDFWNDIVLSKGEDYFIGSMVVFKKAKQQFGIVDGQQRLTTITILLCVIRDKFLSLACNDLAKGVHQLIERKDRSNRREYVLKTETSFPFFQEHIQKFNEGPDAQVEILEEEKNLQNAHMRFIKFVDSTLKAISEDASIPDEDRYERKISKLKEIRDTILNLNLIFITLDNEDDAYLIFETLNTRGKDLALTDLAKNHFSKHLKTRGAVDHAKLKWDLLLQTIRNSSADISTDTFIYHFWASRYDAVPLKKLFPKIKKSITKTNAKQYLDDLVSDSKLYRSIHEPNYNWDKNELHVARSLEAMQMFKLSQPTPAVLSLVRSYRENIIKYAKLRDTFKEIEKFHFIFTAITSSRSSGGISAMYSSFARKLFEAKDSYTAAKEIKELRDKLKSRVPSFEEFKVAFKEVIFTNKNSKQKNLVRYILRNFSEYYSYTYPTDYAELTIEHIHPQSKSNSNDWSEEVVGCIGNLMFIDENMNLALGNKSFVDKKEILFNNNYGCPEFVFESDEWTPENVISHCENMADVAYNLIWKI